MSYLPRTLFINGESSTSGQKFKKVQNEREFLEVVKDGFFVSGFKNVEEMIKGIPEVKSIFDRREQIMNKNAALNSEAGIANTEVIELKNQISELRKMVMDNADQMTKMSSEYQKVVVERDKLLKNTKENTQGGNYSLYEKFEKEHGKNPIIAGGPLKGQEIKAFKEWKEKNYA